MSDERKLGSGFEAVLATEAAYAHPELFEVGSMLSYDERLLLHWATRAGSAGPEAVIDAGCFLGGSTVSLGGGVLARECGMTSPIHVYDRFEFAAESERTWVPDGFEFAVGSSTMAVFEHQVQRVRPLLQVHAGDVRDERWGGGPIGVLFVDIAKTWDTGDAVWRSFLPSLVPRRSIVIQQDLVHWGHPWCAIIMELLADRFEYLGWAWYSSAAYRCTRSIAPSDIPDSLLYALSVDEKLELVDRCATRIGEPVAASIRMSGAVVLASHGRFSAARERVETIRGSYSDDDIPYLSEGFGWLDAWIAALESGTTGGPPVR